MPLTPGNAYLDSLYARSMLLTEVVTDAAKLRDFLLHALISDVGVVVYEPGAATAEHRIRLVNDALLTLLHYPDQATYAAAVAAPGFVHPDDAAVAQSHIDAGSSAVYDARFLRGDNGEYRRCRLQGASMYQPYLTSGQAILRVTIVQAVP